MKQFYNVARGIEKVCVKVGQGASWLLIPALAIIIYDVICRRLFNNPNAWAFDVTYVFSGFMFTLAMSWAQVLKRHVVIDITTSIMKPRTKAIWESIFIPIIAISVLVLITYEGTIAAIIATQNREAAAGPVAVPLYHLRWTVPVGFGLMTLQMIVEWIKNIIFAVKGKSIEELVAEEGKI